MSTQAAASPARDGLFCIVLAAGAATRFGSLKQLAEFRGQPLVARAMRLAEAMTGQRSLLVAGNQWSRVAGACAPLQGYLVVNPDFAAGLGGSIAAGVAAVAAGASGVLLLMADQPLIEAQHLHALIDTWSRNPDCAVCSEYAGVDGPPVIFGLKFFAELLALKGDSGARSVLQAHPGRVLRVACAAGAEDIDTPADLEALRP